MILSRTNRAALAGFAASNVLVAFDYDGTLAPIVRTPAAARMRARTRRLLARVAERYPCIVISGRPLEDVTKRLGRIPVWHVVGEHGFEAAGQTIVETGQVRTWVDELRRRLPPTKGLVIEQKRHSVTVHYRNVRGRQQALLAIAEAVRHLHDARAIDGAAAINLLPFGGPDKGVALQRARRAFACDTAIYVGDDDTDEDAFRSAPPDRLLSIRVGLPRPSAARYRLRSQLDVDALLEALLECRGAGFSRCDPSTVRSASSGSRALLRTRAR